ncbi:MAG: hypothetical protein CMF11_02270 [Idiomarina sp.]|nr:hypothetical protein [Idiomarina sp.]
MIIRVDEYGQGREARRLAIQEAIDISLDSGGSTVSIDGTNEELSGIRLVLAGRAGEQTLVSDGVLYEGVEEAGGEVWTILVCEDE